MTATAPTSTLPVVSLDAWSGSESQRAQLADDVRQICHDIGFFLLVDHGIDRTFMDRVFATMRQLFDLNPNQKMLIDKRQSPHFRGWEGEGAEYTNNRPDIREQVDLWSEHPARSGAVDEPYLRLLGPNQWFPEDILPGFRELMDEWFSRMGCLAGRIMEVLATGLGLEPDHFDRIFGDERMSLTKLIRYPPTPEGHAGVNAHHDTGFLTILAAGETPGLEVENEAADWIRVPPMPEAFVINLGETLQGMTGNYFVATPHRVHTDDLRYSAGYFHGPSLRTTLEPLDPDPRFAQAVAASPRHSTAGFMARKEEIEAGVGDMQSTYKPGVYGEQLWNYFARSYPDNVATYYPDG
jgi:isopenicillin N synthase-like dioxygenase